MKILLFLAFLAYSNEQNKNCRGDEPIIDSEERLIDEGEFQNCYNFKKSFEIKDNIELIKKRAFYNCWGLSETVTIGQNVKGIEQEAFYNCSQLKEIIIKSAQLYYIDKSCFENCTSLTKLTLPKSITNIGESAFKNCFSLEIELNNLISVINIGNSAFENCSKLFGALAIPKSCKTIGKRAFAYCKNLNSLNLEQCTIEKFEDSTFLNCSGFSNKIEIPDTVTQIGPSCFQSCSGFKGELTIPQNIVKIQEYAFANCIGFNGTLTFNDEIEEISDSAFYNCLGFKTLIFSSTSSMKIGEKAFAYCTGFTGELILPNKVSEIGKSAFENCKGFNKLTTSKSLKIVKERTFYKCEGFEGEFDFSSYSELHDEAFCGCKNFKGKLILPKIIYHKGVFSNCGFTSIDLISNKIDIINSRMFQGCTELTGTIKLNKNSIVYDHAFDGCSKITEININDVSSFYPYAFANCENLKMHIIFSNLIDTIPDGLFCNCYSIELVAIDNKIKRIGESAFKNCKNLKGTLVLPINIERIGAYAFYGAGYSEIVFYPPMPPKECGPKSFSDNQKLTLSDVYIYNEFCGTIINKDEGNDKPVTIPTATPIPESFENIEINQGTDLQEEIRKAFERLRKNHPNSIKIVVLNQPAKFDFSLTLKFDEFIKVNAENSNIGFKEGGINVILNPNLPVGISVDESNTNNDIGCKGSGTIDLKYAKNSDGLVFKQNFDINGTFNMMINPTCDVILNNVKLSKSGTFEQYDGKMTIKSLNVDPKTTFSLENVKINEINVFQTATLFFSDQVDIQNAIINYKIYDFEPSNPIFIGHLHTVPQKINLQKLNSEKTPYSGKNYVIASGWFNNSSCDDWLNAIDFGDSGFFEKSCNKTDTSGLKKTLGIKKLSDNEEYQNLVVKYIAPDPTKKGSTKLSSGAIAGITVGCIAFVAIIVIVVILVVRYKKKKRAISNSTDE